MPTKDVFTLCRTTRPAVLSMVPVHDIDFVRRRTNSRAPPVRETRDLGDKFCPTRWHP